MKVDVDRRFVVVANSILLLYHHSIRKDQRSRINYEKPKETQILPTARAGCICGVPVSDRAVICPVFPAQGAAGRSEGNDRNWRCITADG